MREALLNLSKRYYGAALCLKFHGGEKALRCHDLATYLASIAYTLQAVEGDTQRAINWCKYQEQYFRERGYTYRANMHQKVADHLTRKYL